MFNPLRYEVRIYLHGSRVLPKEKILIGLDLQSGHGIQAANVELNQLFMRIAAAAQIRPKDVKYCRVEVVEEETQQVAWSFYPAVE